jgi:tRNA pseudouridine(54/55) synthase
MLYEAVLAIDGLSEVLICHTCSTRIPDSITEFVFGKEMKASPNCADPCYLCDNLLKNLASVSVEIDLAIDQFIPTDATEYCLQIVMPKNIAALSQQRMNDLLALCISQGENLGHGISMKDAIRESHTTYRNQHQRELTFNPTQSDCNLPTMLVATLSYDRQESPSSSSSAAAAAVSFSVSISRNPVYIGGSYIKRLRHLSHSPFHAPIVGNPPNSVEEYIMAQLRSVVWNAHHAVDGKAFFNSAGREDIDVRMLGKGRPFIMKMQDPSFVTVNRETLAQIEVETANDDVSLIELHVCPESEVTDMKEGECEKKKTYECVIWTKAPFTQTQIAHFNATHAGKDLPIQQQTPLRVLHRRTLCSRSRSVFDLRLDRINDHFHVLRLGTSAGTYVKEFVHSDCGRTRPSLEALLHTSVDILQLDVLEIVC